MALNICNPKLIQIRALHICNPKPIQIRALNICKGLLEVLELQLQSPFFLGLLVFKGEGGVDHYKNPPTYSPIIVVLG